MKENEITKVLDALIEKEITYDEAKDKLFVLYDVVGSTGIKETKPELQPNEFRCSKCGTVHKKTAYAIAQNAMGVELIFNCTCGNLIDL